MKSFFRWLFNIYAGEEKNALRFAALGFLWSLGVTLGQKFGDVLFLIHVGAESLPKAYGIAACTMIILTVFYLRAFHIFTIQRIFTAVLFAGIIFYGLVYFSLAEDLGDNSIWLWYALKIFSSAYLAIVITCFWTFIDQYFHLQDAKRLYTLFTSSVFIGAASTGIIMRSGLLSFQQITLVIIVLFCAAAYGIRIITTKLSQVYDEMTLEETNKGTSNYRALFQAILGSKFTLFLMLGNFLNYVLLVITEYSYLSTFDNYFDPGITPLQGGEENASLTQFLGQLVAAVSVFNLIFGLFLYSRLVRQYGVSHLVLYTPIVLVLTFSGWLGSDVLLFPIMGFFVVEGLLYVVDDNNFNLLLHAVPQKMKYKIRLTIESFSEPTGMLISSLLISFVPLNSKLLGLILSLLALCVALLLRKQYVKAILMTLSDNAMHFHRTVKDWFFSFNKKQQQSAERRLLAILHRRDKASQLLSIETLLGFEDVSILPKLLHFADDLDDQSKMKFLKLIEQSVFAQNTNLIDHLQSWHRNTNNVTLRNDITFFLASQGLLPPESLIEELSSSDLTLKGSAIISLIKSWPDNPPKDANRNRQLAEEHLQVLLNSQNEEEIWMGVKIVGLDPLSQDIDTLLPFLKHSNIKIAREAASSTYQIIDKQCLRYAPTLINQLSVSDTEVRQFLIKALGEIGDPSFIKEIISKSIHFRPSERRLTESVIAQFGTVALPPLLEITKDSSMHDRCRMLSGRIVGRINLSLLQKNLPDIVNNEIQRAYFYFYHYNTIQSEYPELDLKLLQDALLSSFHSVLDFIIQMLGVAGEIEDSELLARSLRNPNPKIRSQVLETLERTCETKIYRNLYPLIADLPLNEKMNAALKSVGTPLSLSELLDKLSRSPMQGDQIIAAAFKYRLDLPNWRESLRRQLASQEEIFHHFAYELLENE